MSDTKNKSFHELMERLRNGSQQAAWEFVEAYEGPVQRVIRRALNDQLRPQFDSIDFVQVVWASLFRKPERLAEFDEPEELLAFLAAVAKHKVLSETRKRRTAKYDVGREKQISSHEESDGNLHKRVETPSALAMANERLEALLAGQSVTVRSVVELRLHGCSYVEIAQALQIHERTARKAIGRLAPQTDDSPQGSSTD